MELYVFDGKKEEEVFSKAVEELKQKEEELLYKKETVKGGLFKSDTVKYTFIKVDDIKKETQEFLKSILTLMGLDVTFESSIRDKQINIKMYSDNNSILIGKNGQTLTALSTIVKQHIFAESGIYPYINLDVENYKDKQIIHLERLAKNLAREVRNTKQEVVMDNMNSYERRVVHNILTDFKGVETISEGEEPNRHVIIKPKND